MTFIRVAGLMLLVACAKEPKSAAPSQATPAVPDANAPQVAATPQASETAFPPEYENAKKILDEWGGEGGKLEQARRDLLTVLEKNRNYAPAYIQLSRLEQRAGYISGNKYTPESLDRAWKFAQHALKLDPQLAEAHIRAAQISTDRGDFDAARNSITRARDLPSAKAARIKLTLAEVLLRENDPDSSAKEVERLAREVLAESNDPRDRADAWGDLLIVSYSRGDLTQTDQAYREILKLRPNSAWDHGNYAGFLLRRGDMDGAIREAERAVSILPYPIGLQTLARSYLGKAEELWKQGQYAAAGSYIEKLARISGEDATVHAGVGSFYERAAIRSKDPALRERARQSYRKALQLKPDFEVAKKGLERLADR